MQSFISQYGYLAVFVLMLAESACIPVPSEAIMAFGGALAAGALTSGTGAHLSLIGVVAAGVAGNVAGSYIAWAVGKYAGQAAVHRWGRRIGIREHEVARATAWFERHGPAAVLLGRIVPVIRTFISLPAGFADMPAGKFGLYTTLGCIPWTAGLAVGGYALGANWEQFANDFHGPTYAIAGVLAVAVVAAIVVYRRRRRAAGAGAGGEGAGSAGPGFPPGQEPGEYGGHPPADWGQGGQPHAPGAGQWGPPPGADPAARQWQPPPGRQAR